MLVALHRHAGSPALSIDTLVHQLGQPAAVIQTNLQVLHTLGYLNYPEENIPALPSALAPIDVRLTAKGHLQATAVVQDPDLTQLTAATFSPDEQADLLKLLLKFLVLLERHGAIPPQRHCLTCYDFHPHRHHGTARPHHCSMTDAPFADQSLRIACPIHSPAIPVQIQRNWATLFPTGPHAPLSPHERDLGPPPSSVP